MSIKDIYRVPNVMRIEFFYKNKRKTEYFSDNGESIKFKFKCLFPNAEVIDERPLIRYEIEELYIKGTHIF